jgi:hypothetical protein
MKMACFDRAISPYGDLGLLFWQDKSQYNSHRQASSIVQAASQLLPSSASHFPYLWDSSDDQQLINSSSLQKQWSRLDKMAALSTQECKEIRIWKNGTQILSRLPSRKMINKLPTVFRPQH